MILYTICKHFTFACKVLLLTILAIFYSTRAQAQVGIFIANGDSIYLHASDTATFFSNVQAEGVFSSKTQSTLFFYGQNWQSKTSSRFPGDGWFVFAQPSSLGSDTVQNLGGVSWANRFPNVKLKNANNLHLTSVSGNRDTFQFDTGHVFHNTFDYVVGDNYPGVISQYNQSKYFVTNHTNVSDSGFLIRHTLSHIPTTFPVGSAINDYTPASLLNNGTPDTFSVRVFPNVYAKGDSGIIDSVNTVRRTWNILESTAGNSSIDLIVQHNATSEGSSYNRSDQYVSRYVGGYNNAYKDTAGSSFWDYAASGNGDANSAGTLTSDPTYGFMAERSIAITTDFSPAAPTRYFTKSSTASPPVPVELLYFTANWITKSDAKVEWSTASELNNEKFVLSRSLDGGAYDVIDIQLSQAEGGNSNEVLYYSFEDLTIPTNAGEVYYALEQFDYDNTRKSFGPIVLTKQLDNVFIESKVYPNPVRDQFHLTLVGTWKGEFTYSLINVLGEEILQGESDKTDYAYTTLISTLGLRHGNYWLRIMPSRKELNVKPISVIILN
jgi:hypothetical protein